jgi:hypothetical protein
MGSNFTGSDSTRDRAAFREVVFKCELTGDGLERSVPRLTREIVGVSA